jgi:phosphate butyryltransferase
MPCKDFNEIIKKVKALTTVKRMAVVAAEDKYTLEAVIHAQKEGIISPILIGDKAKIIEILEDMEASVPESDIIDEPEAENASIRAVRLFNEGKADFLMKGKLDTATLLKAVVNKETGLGKGGVMSSFMLFQVPNYHKLISVVDGGMVAYPTLEQKKAIIENTVGAMRDLCCDCPKVAVLACIEKVNPKMPETVEAYELAQMNRRGEIKNCIVEGPISYDCAMSKEIAEYKGLKSEISGDVDILVAPDIHAANIMGKVMTVTCKAKMAGFIVGAKCPIVLASRWTSAEEKYLSIVISAASAYGESKNG